MFSDVEETKTFHIFVVHLFRSDVNKPRRGKREQSFNADTKTISMIGIAIILVVITIMIIIIMTAMVTIRAIIIMIKMIMIV